MSTCDALGALPSLEESRPIAVRGVSNLSYSRLEMTQEPGPRGSVESAFERADVDSDEELEAIRDSVRSLRAQRLAVEQLKEKAREDERSAESLKDKLRHAEGRIRDLEAQGGKHIVRRLMDEVSELRSRLQATAAALQTREKGVAELREAMRQLEHDRRVAQAQSRAQALTLENQERGILENEASIRRMEDACARLEEKAATAERLAEEKCAKARRDVESMSSLLQEAKAALGKSKRELKAVMENHGKMLDGARKDKESLLFERGQEQERIKELTLLCQRQRAKLSETGQRVRELELAATTSKGETQMVEKQVAELRASLFELHERRKGEDVAATSKLRIIAGRADKLKAELLQAKADSEEKERLLLKHREEMMSFREDVKKLREVAGQQGGVRQALRDKDDTIQALRQRLELERRERGQWAQARTELLSQFCDEENKLRSTLQAGLHRQHHDHRQQVSYTNIDHTNIDHTNNDHTESDYIASDRVLPPHFDRNDHHRYPGHDRPLRPQSRVSSDDNASMRSRKACSAGSDEAKSDVGTSRVSPRHSKETRGAQSNGGHVFRGDRTSYSGTSQGEGKSDGYGSCFSGDVGRGRRRRHSRSKSYHHPV